MDTQLAFLVVNCFGMEAVMKKKSMLSIWLIALWCVLLMVVLGGVTYAWFTFDPYARVKPMSSTVGEAEITLLIAADPGDEFKEECELPVSTITGMKPVSTADLEHFYRAYARNKQGISYTFADVSNTAGEDMIHGVLYLKSKVDNCNVYFNKAGMDFGQDSQMLAALRLGLRFVTDAGVRTYIFSLDEMGNTGDALRLQTTSQTGVVVSSLNNDGTAVYIEDPANRLNRYMAASNEQSPQLPQAGELALCTLQKEETAAVEYWLYLEGCDENCINEVQDREALLQLSFAGVTMVR